ncbi:hypothetical protein L1987_68076 [Smallanthus sonchifolius]|uniref:Uncharacterized protein n=1 Tax=Smallanthus sonchifolius TaxID=185202 RepID=A0ACB9B3C7_9ASTR|nr:hypothetical protein L1987_68076 [Smallanthus sonchifolius]
MKKLYKKSTVHPSPPLISDHLALLPAAIFTLTLTLSPEDKEVLAYLVSSTTTTAAAAAHSPLFNCSCFRCYMSYWVRWDTSPNRHVIHQIIDAFEDALVQNKRDRITKKDRKKKVRTTNSNENAIIAESTELTRSPELSQPKLNELESVGECEEGPVRKLYRHDSVGRPFPSSLISESSIITTFTHTHHSLSL